MSAALARAAEIAEALRRTRPADVDPDLKRELCEIAGIVGVTLDNGRARVAGTSLDFAQVQRVVAPHYSGEWAWGSVAHVIAHSGGRFKS